jgi:4-amino-4-deoxy-L-arabinose transferase-like glycosyltransferase
MNSTGLRSTATDAAPYRTRAAVVAALALLAVVIVVSFRVGFQASDDNDYVTGALGWLEAFPYVGVNHWRLRHTITIPTALFIQALGLHEWVISLSNICYFFAFLGINGYFANRFLGGRAAAFATLMILVAPGLPVVSTYLSPDVPELFYLSTAFWLLVAARDQPQRTGLWLLCGMTAGLSFVNRQTAAAFPLFALLACWIAPGAPRRRYLWTAAAFLGVVGAEWLYLTVMTGQPLYRANIDLHHDVIDRFAEFARVKSEGRWIDNEGNLAINVYLDPFITLLVSQKYPLLFWLAMPAAVAVWKRRRQADARTLLLMAGLGAASFAFVAANPKLMLVPRYFIVVAWSAAMVAGWGLALAWEQGRHKLVVAGMTTVVLAGGVALGVENTDPRVVEREIVRWTAAHPGQDLKTDEVTRSKTGFYFRFAGQPPSRVSSDTPRPGDLFFACEQCLRRCASNRKCAGRVEEFRPTSNWTVVERIDGPRKPMARLAERLHLDRVLPTDIAQRFMAPTARMTIYEVH